MATSSILGGSLSPEEISGKDIHALGPSDNSDSGSDAVGAYSEDELASDTDSSGTGERASVEPNLEQNDDDILPDRIQRLPGAEARYTDDTPVENRQALKEVEELVDGSDGPTPAGDRESDETGNKT